MPNELSPMTRKERFYKQIIDVSAGEPLQNVSALTVDHNDTFTAPSGYGYSPVTVNVPTTGDYTTYVKNFFYPEDIYLTEAECEILKQTSVRIKVGSVEFTGMLSKDTDGVYVIQGISYWILLVYYFGHWTLYTNGVATVQHCFKYQINGSVSSYEFEGDTRLTFYVTSAQKTALDAL